VLHPTYVDLDATDLNRMPPTSSLDQSHGLFGNCPLARGSVMMTVAVAIRTEHRD